jgi:hypothetical protein
LDPATLGRLQATTMEAKILQILMQAAGRRFSVKEIGRMVDREEYREHPHWARPFLEKLVFDRLIWKEDTFYLYPTEEQKQKAKVT